MQPPSPSPAGPERKTGKTSKTVKSASQPAPPLAQAVPTYLSYARKDLPLVQEFRDYLAASGMPMRLFYDLDLQAGQAWAEELPRNLEQSQIVIFFLSPAALDSRYIWQSEVPSALRLAQQGRLHVVPVLLRECAWQKTALASFQLLPRDLRPVDKTRPRARAWLQIVKDLRELLDRPPEPILPPQVPLPSGAERLLLALCAVLDQPAELGLLEHLDGTELTSVWQQHLAAAEGDPQRAMARLAERHGKPAVQPLWAAWMATVHPAKLGP